MENKRQRLALRFKFELSQSLTMPANTVCYIDDITIPHSWWNCELTNNKLYMVIQGTHYIIYIDTQNHNGITLKDNLNYIFRIL